VHLQLELLRDTPRGRAVVERVAQMAGWGEKRADGRALGFASSTNRTVCSAALPKFRSIAPEALSKPTSRNRRSLMSRLDRGDESAKLESVMNDTSGAASSRELASLAAAFCHPAFAVIWTATLVYCRRNSGAIASSKISDAKML
jgi:hypothetical protein